MQDRQFMGAGIAQASTFAMYKPIADKDYESLNGIYNATRNMFTLEQEMSSWSLSHY